MNKNFTLLLDKARSLYVVALKAFDQAVQCLDNFVIYFLSLVHIREKRALDT